MLSEIPVIQVIGTYLAHSTVLLLLVWVGDRCFRIRSLSVREHLWKTAAALPLLTTAVHCSWPAAVVVPLPAVEMSAEAAAPHVGSDRPDVQTAASVAVSESAGEPVVGIPTGPASKMFVEVAGPPLVSQARRTPRPRWWSETVLVLAGGCLLLSGLGMVVLVYRLWQLKQFVARCQVIQSGAVIDAIVQLCEQRGVRRRPVVLQSEENCEPSLVGVVRPSLIVPAQRTQQLNDEQLRLLVAHELAHLVRGDTVWAIVGQVLSLCVCWQPLNRVAVRRWRQIAELQSDDWAVADSQPESLVLADLLTQVAAWRTSGSRQMLLSVAGPPLKERVTRLVAERPEPDRWRSGWRMRVLWLSTLAAIVMLPGWGPALSAGDSETTVSDSPAAPDPQTVARQRSAIEPSEVLPPDRPGPSSGAEQQPQRSSGIMRYRVSARMLVLNPTAFKELAEIINPEGDKAKSLRVVGSDEISAYALGHSGVEQILSWRPADVVPGASWSFGNTQPLAMAVPAGDGKTAVEFHQIGTELSGRVIEDSSGELTVAWFVGQKNATSSADGDSPMQLVVRQSSGQYSTPEGKTAVLCLMDGSLDAREHAVWLLRVDRVQVSADALTALVDEAPVNNQNPTPCEQLSQLLQRLYPARTIEVIEVNHAVLLRGKVVGDERAEIVEIAEMFYPQVLNQLKEMKEPQQSQAAEATLPAAFADDSTVELESWDGRTGLLMFGAAYCTPCQQMVPVWNQLKQDHDALYAVSITTAPQLATEFQIDRIPTFVLVKDGKEVKRLVGQGNLEQLQSLAKSLEN